MSVRSMARLCVLIPILLTGCSDELSLADYEKYDVETWIETPAGQQHSLGIVRVASVCGVVAHRYAAEKGFRVSGGWGYACCTQRSGSRCREKIR
jgi:hypothetical protein